MTLVQVRNKVDESIQRVLMLQFIGMGLYNDDKELSEALGRLHLDLQSNLNEVKLGLEALSAEARS